MQEWLDALIGRRERGERAMLCTVLRSHGSTPRGAGAKMVVFQDGNTVGTIGGGAAELEVTRRSLQLLRAQRSGVIDLVMSPNQVADLGMICGGEARVLLQFLDATDTKATATLEALHRGLKNGEAAWLRIRVVGDCVTEFSYLPEESLSESVDRTLLRGESTLVETDELLYTEPIATGGRVYLFGCGHVAKALTPILSGIDFRVTVLDSRAHLATRERFPTAAEVLVGEFTLLDRLVSLRKQDYAIVMTPAHTADFEVLEQVLRTEAAYVGCIGSKAKVAKTNERLLAAGIPAERIAQLHAPIGLMIGAETPEEIAVSIAAQLIQFRKTQRSLA